MLRAIRQEAERWAEPRIAVSLKRAPLRIPCGSSTMPNQRIVLPIAVFVGAGAFTIPAIHAQSAATSEGLSQRSEPRETSSTAERIGGELPREVWVARYRPRDPLWNGAAIGAGTALGLGLAYCIRASEGGETCDDRVDWLIALGAIGGAIGAGIDALLTRRPIYSRRPAPARIAVGPTISRSAGKTRVAVRGTVSW